MSQTWLQEAIDSNARVATADNVRTVVVPGDISVYQLALKSNVRLVFEGTVTCSASPAVGLADDPTNCLFTADRTVDTGRLNTTLTAKAVPGDTSITVGFVDAKIGPGDWLLISGTNAVGGPGTDDGEGESGPPEPLYEIVQVSSISAPNTINLKTPIKVWHRSATTPHAVQAVTVVENVEIVGGVFDGTGKTVANAFHLRGARNFKFTNVKGRAFSRAVIEAGPGTWGVQVNGYRRLGGSNCDLLATSAHRLSLKDWTYAEDGDFVHAQGYVRCSASFRNRCKWVRIADCDFGRSGGGVQWFGGHEMHMENCTFEDIEGSYRQTRAESSELYAEFGVGFDGGSRSVTVMTEFGRNWTMRDCAFRNIRTPSGAFWAVYWHDTYNSELRNVSVINDGANSPTRNGICCSDTHLGGGTVSGLRVFGCTTPLKFENQGPNSRIENVAFGPTSYTGVNISDNYAIHIDSQNLGQGWTFSNMECANMNPFKFINGWEPYTLRVLHSIIDFLYVEEAFLCKANGSTFGYGRLAQLDAASPSGVRRIVNPSSGGQKSCVIQIWQCSPSDMILCAPAKSTTSVLCDTGAVSVGDRLRHGSTIGHATVDNTCADDVLVGIAMEPKSAGSTGRVRIRGG